MQPFRQKFSLSVNTGLYALKDAMKKFRYLLVLLWLAVMTSLGLFSNIGQLGQEFRATGSGDAYQDVYNPIESAPLKATVTPTEKAKETAPRPVQEKKFCCKKKRKTCKYSGRTCGVAPEKVDIRIEDFSLEQAIALVDSGAHLEFDSLGQG